MSPSVRSGKRTNVRSSSAIIHKGAELNKEIGGKR